MYTKVVEYHMSPVTFGVFSLLMFGKNTLGKASYLKSSVLEFNEFSG